MLRIFYILLLAVFSANSVFASEAYEQACELYADAYQNFSDSNLEQKQTINYFQTQERKLQQLRQQSDYDSRVRAYEKQIEIYGAISSNQGLASSHDGSSDFDKALAFCHSRKLNFGVKPEKFWVAGRHFDEHYAFIMGFMTTLSLVNMLNEQGVSTDYCLPEGVENSPELYLKLLREMHPVEGGVPPSQLVSELISKLKQEYPCDP